MQNNSIIDVIIPAYNEANAISHVIREIPHELVCNIIVCNNGSTDNTAEIARKSRAIVINESVMGYGRACLKGMDYITKLKQHPDIVVFLDGDYSDFPSDMPEIINPIVVNNYDMVIGSRALGKREKGSMTIPQIWGNRLAGFLIDKLYNYKYTDLGPFRAIKYEKLHSLDMQDKNFGWTVEMQIKAVKKKLKVCEVPVRYKNRIGHSKVSGTVRGTIMASYKIIFTILRYL